jgi:hypothetical protein
MPYSVSPLIILRFFEDLYDVRIDDGWIDDFLIDGSNLEASAD